MNQFKNKLTNEINQYIVFIYSLFALLLLNISYKSGMHNFFVILQIISIVLFLFFFTIGTKYSPQAYIFIIFMYQVVLTCFFLFFFWNNQYLLDNNPDWKGYVKWASLAWDTNTFSEYITALKKNTFEYADLGYPLFLYFSFNILNNPFHALLLTSFIKCLLFTISAYYVYKFSLFFTNYEKSKLIFLFYGLNSGFIFFNTVNLKESVFTSICVFCVYNLVCFRNNKKLLNLVLFIFFLALTLLFRVYISIFIFFTFLAVTIFRKFIKKYFYIINIAIIILGYLLISFLMQYIGNLAYFIRQSIGGNSGYSIPLLTFTAYISPIPAFNQLRTTADNFLICAYSIYSIVFSFTAIYEIYLVFKYKKENLYMILYLILFNKLLVILSARSNEYRFQMPLVFTYFIFMIEGFDDLNKYGIQLTRKKILNKSFYIVPITFFALIITFLYNKI